MIVLRLKYKKGDTYLNLDKLKRLVVQSDGQSFLYLEGDETPVLLDKKEADRIVKIITKNKVGDNEAK